MSQETQTKQFSAYQSNPFPGLRASKGSESHLFFGREKHIHDVLNKLGNHHFVAIVGSSGTGKSSLIRTGVLPAISHGELGGDGQEWKVVTVTPGSSPMKNMADEIAATLDLESDDGQGQFREELCDLMKHSTLGLVQAMRTKLRKGEKMLLLIDQFEEVFRFAGENHTAKAEYDQFVHLLIDTVRQRDVPIYLILTLGSDFLGDCVAFEGLPEAINDGHYLVPRLTSEEMRRAITGPIDFASGKISPRLIQHITRDLGSNPDQLPILQHR